MARFTAGSTFARRRKTRREKTAGALSLPARGRNPENYQNQLAENLFLSAQMDLDRMVMGEQYCRSLEERIQVQTSRVLQAEKKVAVCRSQLEKARQELHMLEKLKEKKYGQYLYEENRREQLMLDDLALSRYRSKEDLL